MGKGINTEQYKFTATSGSKMQSRMFKLFKSQNHPKLRSQSFKGTSVYNKRWESVTCLTGRKHIDPISKVPALLAHHTLPVCGFTRSEMQVASVPSMIPKLNLKDLLAHRQLCEDGIPNTGSCKGGHGKGTALSKWKQSSLAIRASSSAQQIKSETAKI